MAPVGMVSIAEKTVEGAVVTIWRDAHHAFYVGRVPDPNLESYPMGAFQSEQAAKSWADRAFPGGDWRTRPAA